MQTTVDQANTRAIRWSMVTQSECSSYKSELCIPWGRPEAPGLAVAGGRGDIYWLSPSPFASPEARDQALPVGLVAAEDLSNPALWRRLLTQGSMPNPSDAARYWRKLEESHLPGPDAAVFLTLLGRKTDYRARADWEELSSLDDLTADLARQYDFPVSILRLFNRLVPQQRREWMTLWAERRVRKNLIREMIEDVYDLDEAKRASALNDCLELAASWKSTARPLPGERLRDLVRTIRRPRLEQLERELREARSRLGTVAGMRIELPRDPEAGRIDIHLSVSSTEQLRKQCDELTSAESTRAIGDILERL